ncbi:hypothetical protein PQZ07_00460 [bacterium]|jgi:hypothetical protein|nr:hypothetical protein [bacterium]
MIINEWTNWKPIFPNGERAKFDSEYIGFEKKNKNGFNQGGCYLYAYDPSGNIVNERVDHLDERVIYIGTAGSSVARGVCSRTMDFSGTIIRGLEQKNPYENGMYFRALYGEENREHLYVAYYPMGFGQDVKLSAHGMESLLLSEYKEQYGELPSVDGYQGPEVMVYEYLKVMTDEQKKALAETILKGLS